MNQLVCTYLRCFTNEQVSHLFSQDELDMISRTLSRKEEIESGKRDQWGNWDIQFASVNTQVPYLDQLILDRLKENRISQKQLWPNQAKFAVCLTHDVDRVEAYSPTSFLRNLKKRKQVTEISIKQLSIQLNIIKTGIKKLLSKKTSDPLWNYEIWCQLEEKYNYFSTYFFFVRPESENLNIYDCDYSLNDDMKFYGKRMQVRDYIEELHLKGNEIGLHGSMATWKDQNLLKLQKDEIDSILKTRSLATRQHYLHFDAKLTPKVHHKSGMLIDSSVGFNTDVGFRAGTTYPFFMTNQLNVLELPLILMDSALFYKNRNLDEAKEKIIELIDAVEEVGGCMTINYHPDYLNNPKFIESYKFLLSEINRRKAAVLKFSEVRQIIQSSCVE